MRLLRRLGHVVTSVADGVEAVQRLSTERFELMLLDLTMPRMTGEEVLRWLRDHFDRAERPRVVVVSAVAAHRRAELLQLGADAVLPKPFRVGELRELIVNDSGAASG